MASTRTTLSGAESVLSNRGIIICKYTQASSQNRGGSMDRRATLLSSFKVKEKEYVFRDENGEEMRPTTPIHIDPEARYGKENLAFLYAYRDFKLNPSDKHHFVIFDPAQEQMDEALLQERRIDAQAKINELKKAGNWTMLGNVLRRKKGPISGVNQQRIYTDLLEIAAQDPAFIEEIFSEAFDEMQFIVDLAVERGYWQKTGSGEYTADGIKGIVAYTDLNACDFLAKNPLYLETLKKRLGLVIEESTTDVHRREMEINNGGTLIVDPVQAEEVNLNVVPEGSILKEGGNPGNPDDYVTEESVRAIIQRAITAEMITSKQGWFQIVDTNHSAMRMEDLVKFVMKNDALRARLSLS